MSLQFDTSFYLEENPDVAAAIEDGTVESAEAHYMQYGAAEGRNPNAVFDTSGYLENNPDVADSGMNPLEHFLQYGAGEGRSPNANLVAVAAGFDEEAYLSANTDVAAAVDSGAFASGYEHWVKYGEFEEGRPEATFNGGTPVSEVIGGEEGASGLTEALAAQEAGELPAEYSIDPSVPRIENDATVASASAALAILAGAANADDLNVGNIYQWEVVDSVENIVADVEADAVVNADEVRVAFEDGDQLTVEQSEALATLDNLEGDLPPVDQEGALVAGLQDLEAAQNARGDFLEGNADNALLEETNAIEGVEEGEEPTNAQVATAIGEADTAADEAVVTAENAVLDAESELAIARAEVFSSESDASSAVEALDAIDGDSRMSDANLAAAATEAQANVEADERQYFVDGDTATEVVDAEGMVSEDYTALYTDAEGDLTTETTDGEGNDYELAGLADTKAPEAYDAATGQDILDADATAVAYDAAALGDLFTAGFAGDDTVEVGDTTYTYDADAEEFGYDNAGTPATTSAADLQGQIDDDGSDATVTLGGTEYAYTDADGSVTQGGEAVNVDPDDGSLTTEANDVDANGNGTYTVTVGESDYTVDVTGLGDDDTEGTASVDDGDGGLTTSETPDAEYTEEDLIELQSAADVQDNITTTQNALDSDISANGDNEALLGELRDAVLAYSAAGNSLTTGETADIGYDGDTGTGTLGDLLENITSALAPVDEDAGDEEAGRSAEDRQDAINGIVEDFTADLYDTEGEDLEPTTAEKGVQDALDAVTSRDELETTAEDAVDAFDDTDAGEVLNIVSGLQDERDELIDAVPAAEDELTAAQDTAAETQALVDELAGLDSDIEGADAALTDAEEDDGLGVNLVDFEDGQANATDEDDIILLSAANDDDGADNAIADFSAEGEDRLFIGTEFTQVDVESDVDVEGSAQGDASALEVFVQQNDAGDTVLSFENEAFAGSASSGADLTQIDLTGVNGDVSISDDGFLTVA